MEYDRYRSIPNSLKKYREAKGLSQSAVAKLLGFKDKTWISHWENGDAMPNLISAIRLSTLYQAPLDELFTDLVKTIRQEW